MTSRPIRALALLSPLLLAACATTTTTTWSDSYPGSYAGEWARYGRVESIRTTVRRQEGNPGAGAAAGAVFGGLLGSLIGGHTHYGYFHPSAAGAVVGAVGGAMVGAAASQGSSEEVYYDVYVRFDDGALETFLFRDPLPFQVGDPVSLTSRGLERL